MTPRQIANGRAGGETALTVPEDLLRWARGKADDAGVMGGSARKLRPDGPAGCAPLEPCLAPSVGRKTAIGLETL